MGNDTLCQPKLRAAHASCVLQPKQERQCELILKEKCHSKLEEMATAGLLLN